MQHFKIKWSLFWLSYNQTEHCIVIRFVVLEFILHYNIIIMNKTWNQNLFLLFSVIRVQSYIILLQQSSNLPKQPTYTISNIFVNNAFRHRRENRRYNTRKKIKIWRISSYVLYSWVWNVIFSPISLPLIYYFRHRYYDNNIVYHFDNDNLSWHRINY